jgi:hypothetical protein
MREAKAREATVLKPCETLEDANGIMKVGEIAYAGDTTIKFVERMNYRGVFAPGSSQSTQRELRRRGWRRLITL